MSGRGLAWAYGGLTIAAGLLATAVSIGIPPTEPDLAKHYAYVRQIWPELYISFLLFMAAMVYVIALAVVLREFFGRSVGSELLYAWFLAAGLVGMAWMLVQIGSAQAVVRETNGLSGAELQSLGNASGIWSGVINWLQRGFVIFAGLGTLWTGWLGLKQLSLPVGLGWVSVALAILYWLGFVNLILFDLGASFANSIGSLIVGVGALLAFVWAAWLGWELGLNKFQSSRS